MSIEDVLSHFQGWKHTGGGQYMARCPAHQDKTPSLSITEKDGKVLLYCFGGCKTEDVISAAGLRPSDLFSEPLEKDGDAKADTSGLINKKEVTRYKYEVSDPDQESGWRTTGWKIRYEYKEKGKTKKTFSWLNADGSPTAPKEKTLYNYRAVMENPRDIVYVVEGEKDVDTMTRIGLVAVCASDGCGKWDDRYTDLLTGATVRIVPDYDEAGLKAGLMIEDKLRAADIAVTMHPLTRIKGGKDVSDYKSLTKIKMQGIPARPRSDIEKMLERKRKHSESTKKLGNRIKDRVDSWLEDCEESFSVRFCCAEINAHSLDEKDAVRAYINLLASEGHLLKDRGKTGRFRKPASKLELMDWDVVDHTKSNVWLPLNIHEMVDIFPGNTMVIAGQGNKGKSMMSKKIALENLRRGFPVNYLNSESLEVEIYNSIMRDFGREGFEEFRKFKQQGLFKMVERSSNFHEVIRTHALNIVDFWERHENFAEAGGDFKLMHDALGSGLLLVNQQLRTHIFNGKRVANDYGVGGEATIEKSRLYITLSQREGEYFYRLKIQKAKMWPQGKENPNFKEFTFIWNRDTYEYETVIPKVSVTNTNQFGGFR